MIPRSWLLVPFLAVLSSGGYAQSGPFVEQARRFLAPHGVGRFPPLLVQALGTWLEVEDLYRKQKYLLCRRLLDALFADHPPGAEEWGRARSPVRAVFLGRYPCYYALRMLSTCVDWRLSVRGDLPAPKVAVLGIALVGKSRGMQPRSMKALQEGKGVEISHSLTKGLLEDKSRILHQSLWLFREYVLAITKGRLAVEARILPLPDLEIPVRTVARPARLSGIAKGGMLRVWTALSSKTKRSIDWWWVIYPSHVPEEFPDFEQTEFITGGMGTGPDGTSPCFISDDLWLLRKPPHLGKGRFSDIERRAYLPHWLQHEFFHHLYRSWPEFELEKKSHQWFNRTSWPKDFTGRFEPDYYHESIVKRLQKRAKPPMHVKLRYRPPSPRLLSKLRIDSLIGDYEHLPVQNRWHRGKIERAGREKGEPVLRWRNEAGVSWKLYPDLAKGFLRTGKSNPYYNEQSERSRVFRIVLHRTQDGEFTSKIEGFRFQAGFYRLLKK